MASFFTIPETNQIVYEGDVVQLNEYPDVNFITGYDWYTYNNRNYKGWYFVSTTTNAVVPANTVDLSLLTVVSSSHQSSVVPVLPPPCPPFPPGPYPYPDINKAILDRTYITVETIAQRNSLDDAMLINGRICRVNHDMLGNLAYYEWDAKTLTWKDLRFSNNQLQTTTLAHDVSIKEGKILSIPVYGHDDVEVDLSEFGNPKSAVYDSSTDKIILTYGRYGLPDSVFEIDVSDLREVYRGLSSKTIEVTVDYSDRSIKAEAILDPANNNAITVTTGGLYVNIDGKVDKLSSFTAGNVLTASADGGIQDSGYSIGSGATMGTSATVIPTEAQITATVDSKIAESGTNLYNRITSETDTKVATAKQEAIDTAGVNADEKIEDAIETTIKPLVIEAIEEAISVEPTTSRDGHLLVYTDDGFKESPFVAGGSELDPNPDDTTFATEAAVRKAYSWNPIS